MHLITLALHPVFASVKVFRFDFGFLQKGIDLFNFFIFCKVGAWARESACSIFSQLFCLTFHSTISSWFPLLCYVGHFWANLDFAMGCWNDFFITHTTLCLSCVYSYFCHLLVDWDLAIDYWSNFLITHTTLYLSCVYSYSCRLLVVWDLAINYWNNFLITHTTLCLSCVYSYSCHLLVVWGLVINYWNNFLVTHPTLCSLCFYNYVCHLWADGNISLVLDIRHNFYLHKTFLSYVQRVGFISVRK